MKRVGNNYAFIDSQNVNLAIREQGWRLLKPFAPNKIDFMNTLRKKLGYAGKEKKPG